jgi:very-short-patch-repair endonuclease
VIGNYIVDFYIKSLGLIIEIDGTSHNEKEKYDLRRENYLKHLGLKIFRITDNRIKLDLSNVLEELKDYIKIEYGTYSPPLECDCL